MVGDNNNELNLPGGNELEDFLPIQPAPAAPAKRDYQPWHKPRKQYIRRKQWCQEIGRLIRKIDIPADSKVFRYLTLPSEDMLDVRVLEDSLAHADLKLRYLGFFNTQPGSENDLRMNISENEVKELARIDENSQVFRDLLETAGNRKSKAFRALEEHAPFHAVNIDLCGHLAAPRRENANSCIDAIRSIAEVQARKTSQGWLFFLTTRVQPDQFDADHLSAFVAAILDNMGKSAEFSNSVSAIFDRDGAALIERLEKAREMNQEEFRRFFCIGFGKWFLAFLMAAHPQTQVEMLPSYYYAIQGGRDMLSLAFRCTPRIMVPVDPYGLVQAGSQQNAGMLDEVALGVKVAHQSAELVNIDQVLAADAVLMERMIEDSMRFLQSAHFDVSDYRNFALESVAA